MPHIFAIWWTAWNSRDPINFPLPAYMSNLTDPTIQLSLGNFLFKHHGGLRESRKGRILRKAWEILEPIPRDLMMQCWCGKMSGINMRNPIVHPVIYKKQAEEILSNDLHDKLSYLHSCALTIISNAPETFK